MKAFRALGALLCAAALSSAAMAQQIPDSAYTPNGLFRPTQPFAQVNPNNGSPCIIGNSGCPGLGSSASLSPWLPDNGSLISLAPTTSSAASSAFSGSGTTVYVKNIGVQTFHVRVGTTGVTAVVTDERLLPGMCGAFSRSTGDRIALIADSGTGAAEVTTGTGNPGFGTCTDWNNPAGLGSKQSGVTAAVIGCDSHVLYDASDNGSKTLVAGVSSKKIYVCGYTLATGGTATNLSLSSGTGTDCVTTSVNITPAYQLVANDRVGANAAFWNGLITLANADNLCVKASAGNAHQVEIWYTVQ